MAASNLFWGNEQNDAQSTLSLQREQQGGMFPKIFWQQGTIWFCNQWHAYGQSCVSHEIRLGGGDSSVTGITKKPQKILTPLETPLQQEADGSPGLSHTDTAAPGDIVLPTT